MNKQQGNIGLIVFAFIGVTVAAGAFFITFITTQKASEPHKRIDLFIPVPSDPPRASFEALPSTKLLLSSPSPETTPTTDPFDETQPTL